MNTPEGFQRWNPAMRGAYTRGWRAGRDGLPRESPYQDKRNVHGRLTWSRAFERAWADGWGAGAEQRRRDHINDYYSNKSQRGQPPGIPR